MTSKKILFFLFAIFPVFSLFTSCKVNQQNVVTISPSLLETGIPKKVTVTDITEEDIRNHISVLASDSMQGRKINTPYEAMAAEYIKEQFNSLGLKAFDNNYLQPVPVYSNSKFTGCEFYFDGYEGKYPETQWVMSQNVVGYLETAGSGNDQGYIVVGAHYDHVGTKTDDDVVQIFNGADDNASGVAGVLEIAEKLNAVQELRYNIIFVAFGAEEAGLVGSRVFCDNPPVPIEKIKLMVNLDMIGRMDSSNHIYINTIEATSRFDTVLDAIKKMYPEVNVAFKLDGYLRGSDHTSFFNKNIPVVYFTTGLHNDYHQPTDTADRINLKGQKILLDFVYDFIISSFY